MNVADTTGGRAGRTAARDWLLGCVCPFWAARIIDAQGGFFEALDADGVASPAPVRSVLNQARLTYVFSHASLLAGGGPMRAAADHGFDFLRRAALQQGGGEGWARSTGVAGQVIDATRDAYDQAFVIFALAWYHRATGSRPALEMAAATYAFMERCLRDPLHGGFFEEYPATGKLPRRQNPHMHLLEAALAMHEATGDALWLDRAGELIALFSRHFFDSGTGSLAEYFNADWSRAAGAPGALREPGHQFEWVWLLGEYLRLAGDRLPPERREALQAQAQALFDFGTRHGLDGSGALQGLAFDAVDPSGGLVTGSKLVWPQTEYIKACIARFDATGDAAHRAEAVAHQARLRRHFFYADGANWVNHVARDGAHLVQGTPSRVLYHVFLAAAELARVEEAA